jgi:hypothetical protein
MIINLLLENLCNPVALFWPEYFLVRAVIFLIIPFGMDIEIPVKRDS